MHDSWCGGHGLAGTVPTVSSTAMTIPASSTKIALRASRAGDWKPDKRGLMPLAAARDLLKRKRIIHYPRDAELSRALLQQCAALLSLDGPEEAEKALYALTWNDSVGTSFPGQLLVDRYGAPLMLRFLISCMGMFNVLHSPFEDALEMLRKMGGEEAFELGFLIANVTAILMFKADRKRTLTDASGEKVAKDEFFDNWRLEFAKQHPAATQAVLSRRAAAKDKRAQALLALITPAAKGANGAKGAASASDLSQQILEVLDECAEGADWPRFATGIEDDPATMEYFELRMLAVRSRKTDAWGIAFERLSGSYDPWEPPHVQRYLYGSQIKNPGRETDNDVVARFKVERVPDAENGEKLSLDVKGVTVSGPAGPLALDPKKIAKRDLKPGLGSEYEGDPGFNLRLRAYVDAHPGLFFSPAKTLVKLLGVPDALVVCDSNAFAHAVGKWGRKRAWTVPPSKSAMYLSLAKALTARDPSLVQLGESNLDFRLHAVNRTR